MYNTIKRFVLMTSYEENESNVEKESNNNKGNASKVPTPRLSPVPSFWFYFVCNY